jgi:DNA modification methylase
MLDFESSFRDRRLSVFDENLLRPRHRWYFFKEGFSAQLVGEAISSNTRSGRGVSVLDPFVGSGTTILEAAILGAKATGIEVNPFLAFVARAKTSVGSITSEEARSISHYLMESGCVEVISPVEDYSTFTDGDGRDKWLFNRSVLRGFSGMDEAVRSLPGEVGGPVRVALFSALMDNCNAKRDGKCLRYRRGWQSAGRSSAELFRSFGAYLQVVLRDMAESPLASKAIVMEGDTRRLLRDIPDASIDLVVTSPPYLNSFDYSDIYRPELFVGGFVATNSDLMDVRLKTVRSHVQAKWEPAPECVSGRFSSVVASLRASEGLWSRRLPEMVNAYFFDMATVLRECFRVVRPGGEAWLVVSTSAYGGVHVPVDLILGDIATSEGWRVKSTNVLRQIRSAGQQWAKLDGSQYGPLRETLVILKR